MDRGHEPTKEILLLELNQVTLPATDIGRSVEFYRRMGFTQVVDTPHYARFQCRPGGPSFSIHQVDHVPEGSRVMVYFETDDVDAEIERLERKGIHVDQEPIDQRWLWREARLRDPDGNRICIYYAGYARLYPPWRVDGRGAPE